MESRSQPPHAPAEAASTSPDATSGSGVERLRRYIYWSLIGTSLGLVLLFMLTGPVPVGRGPWGAFVAVSLVIYGVAVAALTGHHIPPTASPALLPRRVWWTAAIAGSATATVIGVAWARTSEPFLWSLAPAILASLLLASVPRRARRVAVAVIVAVAIGLGALIGIGTEGVAPRALALGSGIMTAFLVFVTLASIWMWDIVVELDVARRTAAGLAVANERLRFAADLHDIQGHHLQVIALKSELAARLVRADPDTALHEIESTHRLALDALRDTRAVVQGYRRTSLATEIGNATTVLGSAGIDARLEIDPDIDADQLPEASRHLLGLIVREAITNVLRHSAARHAEVQLSARDAVRLRISNDGVSQDPEPSAGGLQALADRLRAAGGSLTWRRHDGDFEVTAQLPTEAVSEPNDTHASAATSETDATTDAPDATGRAAATAREDEP